MNQSILPTTTQMLSLPNVKTYLSDETKVKQQFYTLVDHREDINYLNVLSIARSYRKLLSRRQGSTKLDDPELKTLDGIQLICFVWIGIWLGNVYQLDLQEVDPSKYQELLDNNKIAFVLIVSSYVAVDLFIMYSAFFVTYSINRIAKEYNGLSLGAWL